MNAKEIAGYIANSTKKTTVQVFLQGEGLEHIVYPAELKRLLNGYLLIGEWASIQGVLDTHAGQITDYHVEVTSRNSAVPLLDYKALNARIEPGAIIRDRVEIGDRAVIMMGAVLNIGSSVGEETMIDMNAVLGGGAIVGKRCHIGAGCVVAGTVEPASPEPVVIEDDVLLGANVVVLEGVRVGKGSVVGAGSVVTKDIPPYSVAFGVPAKLVKEVDAQMKSKTEIVDALRNL